MQIKLTSSPATVLLGIVMLTFSSGCSPDRTKIEKNTENKEVLNITVSIDPQKYFVEQIGGDLVKVNVMVPAGVEPHNYEPRPKQLRNVAVSEAYIIVGGDSFEKAWMPKIKSANKNLKIIDSGRGITRIKMTEDHHHHHHHHHSDEEAEHEEKGIDPHIWLSPELVKIQAQNIYSALIKLDPENQTEYQQNLEEFIAELEKLDREIENNLEAIENRKFIVFHPAWSYFAKEYDLEQIPIEVEGTEPSAAELKELIEEAREENIKIIFVEPQFSQRSARVIAKEIDGTVIAIDPLAENWSKNLLKVSEIFARELGQ